MGTSTKTQPIGIRLPIEERAEWEAAGRPNLRAWLMGRGAGTALEVPVAWIAGPYLYQSGPRMGQVMNPRTHFPADKLADLARSLRANGQMDAVKLHMPPDAPPPAQWTEDSHPEIRLVDGERRWRAAPEAGLVVLRAEIKTYTDREALETARITGSDRENLSPMDVIRANAVEWEIAQAENELQSAVALRCGYDSQATFSNDLRLLRLPAVAQDLVDRGVLAKSHAKNHLLPFVDLPADVGAGFYAEACKQLDAAASADPDGRGLTGSRVRDIVGQVAVSMSLPVVGGVVPGENEDRPLFPEAEHDGADGCDCGAPRFLYVAHAPAHRRCFRPEWVRARNAVVKEARSKAARQALEDVRAEAAEIRDSRSFEAAQNSPANATADSRGDSPDTGGRDPEPCPRGATLPAPAASPAPAPPRAAERADSPPPPYRPGQVLEPGEMARYGAAGWSKLGRIDSTGAVQAVPGNPIPTVPAAVAPGHVRYSRGDHAGEVVIWCSDPGSLEAARRESAEVFAEHLAAAQVAFADGLRRDAAGADTTSPAGMSGLLMALGRVSSTWLPELARALGHTAVPQSGRLDDYRPAVEALGKGELQIMLRVVSRLSSTNTLQRVFERDRWATEQASVSALRHASQELSVLVEQVPPDMDPASVGQIVADQMAAAEMRVLKAIRPPLAEGDEIPLAISSLREAHASAAAYVATGGASPVGIDMGAEVERVGLFLREHPGVLDVSGPADRVACYITTLRVSVETGRAAARDRDEGLASESLEKVERVLARVQDEIAAGVALTEDGPDVLASARAFVEWMRGEAETLFGDVAPLEAVAAEEAEPGSGPAAQASGRLHAALLAACRFAENVALTAEDAAGALGLLGQRHREAREFRLANELPQGAAYLLDAAIERAEALLAETSE
ncbi:MAG TPA: ParB N-terminal domain-containing protein [Longimicrobium sp.]|nr:ParB N-terminal domain-containing protein [Longimicrobium sp.]